MKLDAHVHTIFSGKTTIYPVSKILNESYNSPEKVYRRAKARGMDLVAITDHDTINGALTIADRDDVVVGCEVTAVFPHDGVAVHLGVLGINETQHREIQELRHNIRELMPYLKVQGIFSSLNHVASRVAGKITADHIAMLIPWVDGVEVLNGSRLPAQNRTAAALCEAYGKVGVAGSDSHTFRGIGQTYMVAEQATNRGEFLAMLKQGRIRVEGKHGNNFTLVSDIARLTSRFYEDAFVQLARHPLHWRRYLMVLGSLIGLPLVSVPLLGAAVHFALEERFNQALLFDLVAKPAVRAPELV